MTGWAGDHWSEAQADAYLCAVDKGWEEDPCTVFESFTLIDSEIAELLEEVRHKKPLAVTYFKTDDKGNEKPEGPPIELADIVIRVLHFFARHSMTRDTNWWMYDAKTTLPYGYDSHWGISVPIDLSVMQLVLWQGLGQWVGHGITRRLSKPLTDVLWLCEDFARRHNIDLAEAVDLKARYNWTRDRHHGGKAL